MTRTDPDACARCAASRPTCCELTPGQEELCFPLSRAEMDRIHEFAHGGGDKGWFASERNTAAFMTRLIRLFPTEKQRIRRLFPVGEMHYRLATDRRGRCKLLGEKGCILPVEARPYYCRLFPLWVESGRITVLDADCPARHEAGTARRLFETFGVSPVKILDLFGRLRLAWGLGPEENSRTARSITARYEK